MLFGFTLKVRVQAVPGATAVCADSVRAIVAAAAIVIGLSVFMARF